MLDTMSHRVVRCSHPVKHRQHTQELQMSKYDAGVQEAYRMAEAHGWATLAGALRMVDAMPNPSADERLARMFMIGAVEQKFEHVIAQLEDNIDNITGATYVSALLQYAGL